MGEQDLISNGYRYDFIVLTAAITRPNLHNLVFPVSFEFMRGLSIKWLINIDDVDNASSIDETRENFSQLFADTADIDVELLNSKDGGCFFSAARRLSARALELLPYCKTGVVWLEDDWLLNGNPSLIRFLTARRLNGPKHAPGGKVTYRSGSLLNKQTRLDALEAHGEQLWYFALVSRAEVSFNPGIWSKRLFARGFQRLLSLPEGAVDDPESVCADPFNESGVNEDLTMLVDPVFQDAGRQWSAQHGWIKWDKDKSRLLLQGSVTYPEQRATVVLSGDEEALLDGYVLLPDLLFNSTVKLIARTRHSNDAVTAQLLAVPFLTIELRVVERWTADVFLHRSHANARTCPFKKTSAQVVWNFGNEERHPDSVSVRSPLGDFTADYSRKLPWCSLWMFPLQAIAGLIVYVVDLFSLTKGLDRRREHAGIASGDGLSPDRAQPSDSGPVVFDGRNTRGRSPLLPGP